MKYYVIFITSSWFLFHKLFSNDLTCEICFPNERCTLQHCVHNNIPLLSDAHVASKIIIQFNIIFLLSN